MYVKSLYDVQNILLFLVVSVPPRYSYRRSLLTNFRRVPLSFLTRIRLIFFFHLLKPLTFKSNLHYHRMIASVLYNKNRCTIYDSNYYNVVYNIIASDSKRCFLIANSILF